MYATVVDHTQLRQGDIVGDVLFPRYAFESLGPIQRWKADGTFEPADKAVLDVRKRHAVVVSQCCEFNEGKRNAFSIASLLPLRLLGLRYSLWGITVAELVPLRKTWFRGRVEPAMIASLLAANKIDPTTDRNEAVNVYLFPPDGTQLTEHYVADFSQVFSIRMADSSVVLRSKILELDPEHRREFQIKLAYFYGRRAT